MEIAGTLGLLVAAVKQPALEQLFQPPLSALLVVLLPVPLVLVLVLLSVDTVLLELVDLVFLHWHQMLHHLWCVNCFY